MHVDSAFLALALLVVLAVAFDFMNGFHDAANSIATIVSTRVLKPYQAVIWAAVAKSGFASLLWPGIIRTTVFILVAPLLGLVIGGALMLAISWACFRIAPARLDRWFRLSQLLSSALYSVGHGSNDAQKTMGVIWLLLISHGLAGSERLPDWVIVSCYLAMAFGTLCGGWRIIRTMGQKLTKLTPASGSAASMGGAATLFIASHFGIPVSTTHTITGAILGTGAVQNPARVRWGLATNLVYAWVLTIPAAGLVAGAAYYLVGRIILK